MNVYERLIEYFKYTSEEMVKKDWDSTEHLDDSSKPTINEFIKQLKTNQNGKNGNKK